MSVIALIRLVSSASVDAQLSGATVRFCRNFLDQRSRQGHRHESRPSSVCLPGLTAVTVLAQTVLRKEPDGAVGCCAQRLHAGGWSWRLLFRVLTCPVHRDEEVGVTDKECCRFRVTLGHL